MKKTLKRTLSLVLAVLMVASVACFAVSANDGLKELKNIKDVVVDGETNTYYFYMPDGWKNEYNDYYDGTPESYCAGIYWWEGTYNCEDNADGWPGYAITETVAPNVYVANVPTDVTTVVWNNSVDGGTDNTLPVYTAAVQASNAGVEYYDVNEDGYGFYPNGTTTMNNMIYVCNPEATEVNELSGKVTYKGVWFYYYGDGKYGIQPTLAEAEAANAVYQNGEFPAYGLQISPKEAQIGTGETTTLTPNKSTAVATIDNEAVATIAQDPETGVVTVTGVAAGTATVSFTYTDTEAGEVSTKDVVITVVDPSISCTKKTLKAGKTLELTVENGEVSKFTSSNAKVAKVSKDGVVTALKKGSATITATLTSGAKLKCKITVSTNPTATPKKMTLKLNKAKTKTGKIKVTGAVGKVTYKTNNKKVATVKNGKVTGKKAGKATITVTANGVKLKVKVVVKKK